MPTVNERIETHACLIKSGTLSDVLEQLFPNLQEISDLERPEVLRTLVSRFSPRNEQPAGKYGARCKEVKDDSNPLPHSGQEATAQYMSCPKPQQEFHNVTELAKHEGVTRKTVHVWMKRPDVLRRAHYLAVHRKSEGDLIARREWPGIVQALCDKAKKTGDVAAARFVNEQAWREQAQPDKDNLSVQELFQRTLEGTDQ